MNANRLAVAITHADGQVTRWGHDEPEAAFVPVGLNFRTTMPGGFADLSLTLARRIDVDYPDLNLLDDVRVYGPGNETVYEGRVVQLPRQHGDTFGIQVGAVGWAAHLRDDPTFTGVYVDATVGAWEGPSLAERARLAGINADMGRFDWTVDNGLSVALPNQALPVYAEAQRWYAAPAGRTIAKMMYRGAETNWPSTANIEQQKLYYAAQDDLSSSSNSNLTLDDTLRTVTLGTARRYLALTTASRAVHTPTAGALRRFTKLAVYGNHGLTSRSNGSDPDGFYASDVIADILDNAAPDLTYTTGTGGSIEATTFVIPHLVFSQPVTAEDAIMFVNAYHQHEWGVYEDREFFWRATDEDRVLWEARLSDGAHLQLEGDQADDVYNGVYVTYTDATGSPKSVGPTGASADATDASLIDTTDTNPINAHGITRRWAVLNISQVTTEAGAIQLGARWLEEHSLPQRRGTLTLTGTVTHPTRGDRPAWAVRAGDYVRIADHPADVPRRIIETRYDDSNLSVSITLDNSSHRLDAILERLGVALVGVA